jgi:hypothetical protein
LGTFDIKLPRGRPASNGLHYWSRRSTKNTKINEKKALKLLGMGGTSHDRSAVYKFPRQSFLMMDKEQTSGLLQISPIAPQKIVIYKIGREGKGHARRF